MLKWLGCAAVGATMFFAGSSAFAVTIGFSQVGDEGDWRPAFVLKSPNRNTPASTEN